MPNQLTAQITLYDLSSSYDPQFWSPNTGKVRCLLNYLDIHYDLQFVNYADIRDLLSAKGVPSWQEQGVMVSYPYSLPAVTFAYADGSEETVMGGGFHIIDKLIELVPDLRDKIYGQNEEFERLFEEYRDKVLGPLAYHINDPFMLNSMDDQRAWDFYQNSRKEREYGDMVALQKWPREELLEYGRLHREEVTSLKRLKRLAQEKGIGTKGLDTWVKGEAKFLTNDEVPTYADFTLFAHLVWSKFSIEQGSPDYDLFESDVLKAWFDRMEKYNY